MQSPEPRLLRRLRRRLLAWYDRERRDLPWRSPPGAPVDPYRVWLSEIMLQQTTVATVRGRFAAFLDRWPTVDALARARRDAVLHAWQGLGYYARARNLHACAQAVVRDYGGRFPSDEASLRALPGVGAYTAAAIAAIAFDRRVTPIDGNVARVVARLFALDDPPSRARPIIAHLARALTPDRRAGDFAQGMMDLGATICGPRRADCDRCPWRDCCAGRASGEPLRFPTRAPRIAPPLRHGVAFWTTRPDGAVLLRRRATKGLLGGMIEVPSTAWREAPWEIDEAIAHAPCPADWTPLPGVVRHAFTHFRLELVVLTGAPPAGMRGLWASPARFADFALPTVMKKVAAHVRATMPAAGSRGTGRRRAG